MNRCASFVGWDPFEVGRGREVKGSNALIFPNAKGGLQSEGGGGGPVHGAYELGQGAARERKGEEECNGFKSVA
jgi:hypothetical protein